ncbi:MAG: IS66 family insertion sequence element accessory protein TnpB [Enterocloster sp.]
MFLFCGKRCDRIKVLLREPDGCVLLYKRLSVTQGRLPLATEAFRSPGNYPASAWTGCSADWTLNSPKAIQTS